jgi:hypothetical protein
MRRFLATTLLLVLAACESAAPAWMPTVTPPPSHAQAIPPDLVKHGPADDPHPPLLHSDEWQAPIPVPGPINSAGAEDSPFISPDGELFFFFFTPDVRIPAERQLVDGVTGIYVSQRSPGGWSEPTRVILQDPGELALDGCEFYTDGELWFYTVRRGIMREIDIWLADFEQGQASNWRSAGEELNLDVGLGEFHFSADGQRVYFHSDREGGVGGIDLWMASRQGDGWGAPHNLSELNTPDHDGWPYLSTDGSELWFTRTYQGTPAIFRSRWTGAGWDEAELIVSQFAGEPTFDDAGNLYFVHHYYQDGEMLEADLYVAYRK